MPLKQPNNTVLCHNLSPSSKTSCLTELNDPCVEMHIDIFFLSSSKQIVSRNDNDSQMAKYMLIHNLRLMLMRYIKCIYVIHFLTLCFFSYIFFLLYLNDFSEKKCQTTNCASIF